MSKQSKSRRTYHQDSQRNGNQEYSGWKRDRTKHVPIYDHINGGGQLKENRGSCQRTKPEAEHDIDMADDSEPKLKSHCNRYTSTVKNNHGRQRDKATPFQRPRSPRRKIHKTLLSWYKVMVHYGAQYDMEYILKLLEDAISPVIFIPRGYHVVGAHSFFYVVDFDVADKLLAMNRRITTSKGFKLVLKIVINFPNVTFTPEIKQSLQHTLLKRYNRTTESLDLSNFHNDEDIFNYHIALFRHNLVRQVLDVVAQLFPDLVALNLSNNRFHELDGLKQLSGKLPKLSNLHFGNNKVEDVAQLLILQDVPLLEIVLEGNPLRNKFKDQVTYVSEIRKIFLHINKLDGWEVLPSTKIDVDISCPPLPPGNQIDVDISCPTLPPGKPLHYKSFMVSEEGSKRIGQFIQQYYQVYDSENRNTLINAYHEISSFSLSCVYQRSSNSASSESLVPYFTETRNFLETKDPIRRQELLRCGNSKIALYLTKLPRSKHCLESFAVDFSLCTPQHLMVVLTGFYHDIFPTELHLRAFSRTFILSPSGEGYRIVNDQLVVSNSNEELTKSCSANTTSEITPPSSKLVEDPLKQKMIEAMCLQTGMNFSWALKCLQECNWNFESATSAFWKSKDTIPPAAFTK